MRSDTSLPEKHQKRKTANYAMKIRFKYEHCGDICGSKFTHTHTKCDTIDEIRRSTAQSRIKTCKQYNENKSRLKSCLFTLSYLKTQLKSTLVIYFKIVTQANHAIWLTIILSYNEASYRNRP